MPAVDYAHSPHANAARERKAVELESIAREMGVAANDLLDEAVRERLLVALAKARGKRRSQVHASTETWRVVWRFMHDYELRHSGGAK